MNLCFLEIIKCALLVFFASFPLGYNLLSYKGGSINKMPFFVKLPICLSLGLAALEILTFIIGFINVGSISLTFLFSTVILFWIWTFQSLRKSLKFTSSTFLLIERRIKLNEILPAILLFLSEYYFLWIVDLKKWPPVGDIIQHGGITSLFLYKGKIVFAYDVFSYSLITTPIGFHSLVANLSLLLGLYPGESIFILGALVTGLLPVLTYVLAYINTKSITLSILSSSLCFVFFSYNYESWILGHFFNGPYPNIFGYLSIFVFLVVAQESSLLASIIILHLLSLYPSLVLYILPYYLISIVKNKRISEFNKYYYLWKSIILKILFIVSLILFFFIISKNNNIIQQYLELFIFYTFWSGPLRSYISNLFLNPIYSFLFSIGLLASIYSLIKKKITSIVIYYISVTSIATIYFFTPAWIIFHLSYPHRSLSTLPILSLIVFGMLFKKIKHKSYVTFKINKLKFFKIKVNIRYTLNLFLFVLILLIIVKWIIPYYIPCKFGWFHMSSEDYKIFCYISSNISSYDLILNAPTITDFYLLSFSYKNIVFYMKWLVDYRRAEDLFKVWLYPENDSLIYSLLKKYKVKYVVVTSDSIIHPLSGFAKRYTTYSTYMPYSSIDYQAFFDNYDFLKPIFKTKSGTIYRVLYFSSDEE